MRRVSFPFQKGLRAAAWVTRRRIGELSVEMSAGNGCSGCNDDLPLRAARAGRLRSCLAFTASPSRRSRVRRRNTHSGSAPRPAPSAARRPPRRSARSGGIAAPSGPDQRSGSSGACSDRARRQKLTARRLPWKSPVFCPKVASLTSCRASARRQSLQRCVLLLTSPRNSGSLRAAIFHF